MEKSNIIVKIEKDHIAIFEGKKELVYWDENEWIEDPEFVVPAISNAIKLAYTDIKKLKKLLS